MTEPVGPIEDVVAIVIPEGVDDLPEERLNALAYWQLMGQYAGGGRPRTLLVESMEWLVTGDWEDVERFQPAHDCAACRAGNDQAVAFLKEHPDRRIAMGNLKYWEVW